MEVHIRNAPQQSTRIPVDNGFHLHGLMDATGTLEESQIFYIVSQEGKPRVVTGARLMVSRASDEYAHRDHGPG